MSHTRMEHSVQTGRLADILDRILDKGVVIAGDVTVCLVGVELLNIRLRLLTCSVDNLASRRVIERNGGLLQDERDGTLRFWVPTASPPGTEHG